MQKTIKRAGSKVARSAQKAITAVRGQKSNLIRKMVGQGKTASQIMQSLQNKGFSVYGSEVYRVMNEG